MYRYYTFKDGVYVARRISTSSLLCLIFLTVLCFLLLFWRLRGTIPADYPYYLFVLPGVLFNAWLYFHRIEIDPMKRTVIVSHLGLFKKTARVDEFTHITHVRHTMYGLIHNGTDIQINLRSADGSEEEFTIIKNIQRKKKRSKESVRRRNPFSETFWSGELTRPLKASDSPFEKPYRTRISVIPSLSGTITFSTLGSS